MALQPQPQQQELIYFCGDCEDDNNIMNLNKQKFLAMHYAPLAFCDEELKAFNFSQQQNRLIFRQHHGLDSTDKHRKR